MALIESHSGSATIGTAEYSLPSNSLTLTPQTDDGVYQAFIDFSALQSGDSYRVRVLEKCRQTAAKAVVLAAVISGAQDEPLMALPSLLLLHGWDMTVQKLFGADRVVNWSIRKAA